MLLIAGRKRHNDFGPSGGGALSDVDRLYELRRLIRRAHEDSRILASRVLAQWSRHLGSVTLRLAWRRRVSSRSCHLLEHPVVVQVEHGPHLGRYHRAPIQRQLVVLLRLA
jgi:hypothetical protein